MPRQPYSNWAESTHLKTHFALLLVFDECSVAKIKDDEPRLASAHVMHNFLCKLHPDTRLRPGRLHRIHAAAHLNREVNPTAIGSFGEE